MNGTQLWRPKPNGIFGFFNEPETARQGVDDHVGRQRIVAVGAFAFAQPPQFVVGERQLANRQVESPRSGAARQTVALSAGTTWSTSRSTSVSP